MAAATREAGCPGTSRQVSRWAAEAGRPSVPQLAWLLARDPMTSTMMTWPCSGASKQPLRLQPQPARPSGNPHIIKEQAHVRLER